MSQETQQRISQQIRIWLDSNGQMGMQSEGNLAAPLVITALEILKAKILQQMLISGGTPGMINPTKPIPSLKINRMP